VLILVSAQQPPPRAAADLRPLAEGVLIENVSLLGTYPETEIVVIVRFVEAIGMQVGTRSPLWPSLPYWDEDPSYPIRQNPWKAAAMCSINLLEDLEVEGRKLAHDRPDYQGLVWLNDIV